MQCRVCLQNTAQIVGVEEAMAVMECDSCGRFFVEDPTKEEVSYASKAHVAELVEGIKETIEGTSLRFVFFRELEPADSKYSEEEELETVLKLKLSLMTYEAIMSRLVVLHDEGKSEDEEEVVEMVNAASSIFDNFYGEIKHQLFHLLFMCSKHQVIPPQELVADVFVGMDKEVNK